MPLFGEKKRSTFYRVFREKLKQYKDTSKAREWLNSNSNRVKALFENHYLRNFVFEPFKDVFT